MVAMAGRVYGGEEGGDSIARGEGNENQSMGGAVGD